MADAVVMQGEDGTFKSPLENNPKILEKIGLFIVLFNAIDSRLSIEFYYVINQDDQQKRPILNFLTAQDFEKKYRMLEKILGKNLCSKIADINGFRNFVAHGFYGSEFNSESKTFTGNISMTKMARNSGKYKVDSLSEDILDKKIKIEREILAEFHEMILKRLPKNIN